MIQKLRIRILTWIHRRSHKLEWEGGLAPEGPKIESKGRERGGVLGRRGSERPANRGSLGPKRVSGYEKSLENVCFTAQIFWHFLGVRGALICTPCTTPNERIVAIIWVIGPLATFHPSVIFHQNAFITCWDKLQFITSRPIFQRLRIADSGQTGGQTLRVTTQPHSWAEVMNEWINLWLAAKTATCKHSTIATQKCCWDDNKVIIL